MKFTDIIVLLDRSGSMHATRKETIIGLNAFINEQKKLAADGARFTLFQFAGPADQSYTYRNHSIDLVEGLSEYTYDPTGTSTALRNAIYKLIQSRGEEYSQLAAESRPDKVVFVIVTDGVDNASSVGKYTIKEMIKHQTEKYSWNFLYLGAGHDALTAADDYGISQEHAIFYNAQNVTHTLGSTSAAVGNLRSYGIVSNYTKQDREDSVS